jgi:hypothetical protein
LNEFLVKDARPSRKDDAGESSPDSGDGIRDKSELTGGDQDIRQLWRILKWYHPGLATPE